MAAEYCVGLITTGSREEAERIAEALVHRRLAACVTLVPEVVSVYWWEGRVVRDREALLLVKTSRANSPAPSPQCPANLSAPARPLARPLQ